MFFRANFYIKSLCVEIQEYLSLCSEMSERVDNNDLMDALLFYRLLDVGYSSHIGDIGKMSQKMWLSNDIRVSEFRNDYRNRPDWIQHDHRNRCLLFLHDRDRCLFLLQSCFMEPFFSRSLQCRFKCRGIWMALFWDDGIQKGIFI